MYAHPRTLTHRLLLAAIAAGLTGLVGCGDDAAPDQPAAPSYGAGAGAAADGEDSVMRIIEDSVEMMEQMADALASVQDEASAKAAATRIEAIAERGEALEGRMEALDLTEMEVQMQMQAMAAEGALDERLTERMEQAVTSMIQHSMRVMMNPEFAQHIEPAMEKLQPQDAPAQPPLEPLP